MTMTNQTGIDATETIRQDLRAGGNVRLPNGQVLSEDAQILFDKSIVAKALGQIPTESIRVKNTSYRYRWVNRIGANGSLFAKRRSQGWTLASLDEAEPLSVEITNDLGEIRFGDLILMKLPIERYQQAMKSTMEKALFLQRDKRFLSGMQGKAPSTDVFSDEPVAVEKVPEARAGNGKYITNFTPTEAELDAKMGPEKHGRK